MAQLPPFVEILLKYCQLKGLLALDFYVVGTFSVPIACILPPEESHAVRQLNEVHVLRLMNEMRQNTTQLSNALLLRAQRCPSATNFDESKIGEDLYYADGGLHRVTAHKRLLLEFVPLPAFVHAYLCFGK